MKITDILTEEVVRTNLPGKTKTEVIDAMVELAAQQKKILDKEKMREAIFERERIMSTGVGGGFAIPHGKTDAVTDIVGAKEVAQGKADYYLGACATGGGGALSMAIAILGYSSCFTVSMAGKPPKEDEVQKAVGSGKKAYGFTCDHVRLAVPLIVKAILAKHNQGQ